MPLLRNGAWSLAIADGTVFSARNGAVIELHAPGGSDRSVRADLITLSGAFQTPCSACLRGCVVFGDLHCGAGLLDQANEKKSLPRSIRRRLCLVATPLS